MKGFPNPQPYKSILSWLHTIMLSVSLIVATLILVKYFGLQSQPDLGEFKLGYVLNLINDFHIEGLDKKRAVEGILKGLASELGPHARVYNPEDLSSHINTLDGSFVGIGIRYKIIGGKITVITPIENTAAERSGLLTGDRLISADGETLVGIPAEKAMALLRGPVNSVVMLDVERKGNEKPLKVRIVRSPVHSSSISYIHIMKDGETGFIKLNEFSRDSSSEIGEAINKLKKDGAKRLIIDLRHNGGGLLDSGIACADLFISGGLLLTLKSGRQDSSNLDVTVFTATKKKTEDIPLALLIDGGSASSSEVFAAAIKDRCRGILVGSKTYGKGTVQSLFTDSLGGFGLKFTTGLFYSPNGSKIDGHGVKPDINVEQSDRDYLYALLHYDTIETRKYLPDYEPSSGENGMSIEEILVFEDKVAEAARKALAEKLAPKSVPVRSMPMKPAVSDRTGLVE